MDRSECCDAPVKWDDKCTRCGENCYVYDDEEDLEDSVEDTGDKADRLYETKRDDE